MKELAALLMIALMPTVSMAFAEGVSFECSPDEALKDYIPCENQYVSRMFADKE